MVHSQIFLHATMYIFAPFLPKHNYFSSTQSTHNFPKSIKLHAAEKHAVCTSLYTQDCFSVLSYSPQQSLLPSFLIVSQTWLPLPALSLPLLPVLMRAKLPLSPSNQSVWRAGPWNEKSCRQNRWPLFQHVQTKCIHLTEASFKGMPLSPLKRPLH